MPSNNFFEELKRRHVYKVAVSYTIIAWLILQVGSILLPTLNAPDWVMQVLLYLLFIGFPIALILAWAYEISPKGELRPTTQPKEGDITTKMDVKTTISYIVIGILLFVIVGQFAYNRFIKRDGINTAQIEKSIAVLPFSNESSDQENQYFCNGIMVGILDHLSKISDLTVISRSSVEKYRSSQLSAREMAGELEVQYLVEGSVQKMGNQAVISAQLIYAENNKQLWSRRYNIQLSDLFKTQADVAQSIAQTLQAIISPEEEQIIDEIPTTNMKAYDLYLRGRFFIDNYLNSGSDRDFDSAIRLLDQAISLDENFALPYVMMSYANFWKMDIGVNRDSIKTLIDQALALNPDLSEGYAVRGWYHLENGNFELAERDLKYALDLSPNNDWIMKFTGMLYFQQAKFEKTLELWMKQVRLNPNQRPIDFADLGDYYLALGDFQKAEKSYDKALSMESEHEFSLRGLRWLNVLQGNYQRALGISDRLIRLYPDERFHYFDKASTLALLGQFNEALDIYDEGLKRRGKEHSILQMNDSEHMYGYILWKNKMKDEANAQFTKHLNFCYEQISKGSLFGKTYAYYDVASIQAFLGRKSEAIQALKEYAKLGFNFGLDIYISKDPFFENLHEEQEFQDIMADVSRTMTRKREAVASVDSDLGF